MNAYCCVPSHKVYLMYPVSLTFNTVFILQSIDDGVIVGVIEGVGEIPGVLLGVGVIVGDWYGVWVGVGVGKGVQLTQGVNELTQ